MRWPSTQTVNEKSANPNGINNALFDLLSKLNTTYEEFSRGRKLVSSVVRSDAVSLTTATPVDINTLVVPPGDWEISLFSAFNMNALTSTTVLISAISLASATFPNVDTTFVQMGNEIRTRNAFAATVGIIDFMDPIPPIKVHFDVATTVYHVVSATFTLNTCSAYGSIQAVSRV